MDNIQKKQDDEYEFPYHYVSQFRNGFTQVFNDTWGINYVSTIEYIIEQLKHERFNSLIDMGCGDGRLVRELSREFPNQAICGIDYSSQAIGLANIMNRDCEYYQADISSQLVKKADLITLIEVFEHVPPEMANNFVDGIHHHLNDGGVLYITVPHENKPVEYKHYRHFNSKTITECFNDRFFIEGIIPFESNGIMKYIIDIILTNRLFILNNQRLKNYIYNFYKRNLFLVENESECNRLFVKAVKK